MENRKFYIKEWYDNLGIAARKSIHQAYVDEFKVHRQTFYQAVSSENPPADRILWFAEKFNVSLDDLTYPPGETVTLPSRPAKGQSKLKFEATR